MKPGREIIKVIMRRRRILFARILARVEDTTLLKRVMFEELTGRADCVGGQREG